MKSIDSEYIKEIRYEDVESLLKAVSYGGDLYEVFSEDFIFRGHFSEKYVLLPYALRAGVMDEFHPGLDYEDDKMMLATQLEISQVWGEYQLLQRFFDLCDLQTLTVPNSLRLRDSVVKKYDLRSLFSKEEWLPRELWEVAALAQHYGVPTRLLDWTYNVKTALYFSAIDYIKPYSILEQLNQPRYKLLTREEEVKYSEVWALDTKVIVSREATLPLKLIRPPYYGNPNLAAQEGVFTLWPISKPILNLKKGAKLDIAWTDKTPLDELLVKKLSELKADVRPYMYRISFPQDSAVEIYFYLQREGHTAAKLFPGYAGIARSIKETDRFRDIIEARKKTHRDV